MDRDYSKIDPADAPWLVSQTAQAVCDAIAAGGHQILYVGGCVRNALLHEVASDVDMATSATPEQVIALVKAAGLKAVPTGIEHGTVTVVSSKDAYEVTTFRRDVETDGRRAVVAFSTNIYDDARRRDFTMNALYVGADGNVVDPLGGLDDLRARYVRFIEDPDMRIREDYLRSLRYFRFHAWYGDPELGLDADALAAIAANIDGLETLSAERVGAELRKLLSAPEPSTSLAAMAQTGALAAILPAAEIRFVLIVVHFSNELSLAPDWLGRLVALGGMDVPERLRLSKSERQRYLTLRAAAYEGGNLAGIAYRHGADIACQALLLRSALSETPPEASQIAAFHDAAAQVFPVSSQDLMPDYTGPQLGARLAQLKSAWIASGFTMAQEELLALPVL